MARMRTIAECARLLKEDDPDTALTQHALRCKVKLGEVESVLIGQKKRLVNYDALLELLQNPKKQQENVPEYGNIRRIS